MSKPISPAPVSPTPRQASDVLALTARDPKLFLNAFFWTLPGPDDEAIGPRRCELWSGVEDLVDALTVYRRVIGLKSRKIGFTTTGLAFALWIQTFFSFSRAHLFSYRDDAAVDLIRRIKFAHRRLPDYMRLPVVESNDHTLTVSGTPFTGEPDDVRTIKAYPTTEEASADEVADFVMIDEAARIARLDELYAAVEPTVRRWLLIISSGRGPSGDFRELYDAARAGTVKLTPRFYPWTARPGRDEKWRDDKLASYKLREVAKREYPETEEDAFLGLANHVFPRWAIERAKSGARGLLTKAETGRRYCHGWDIGKERDAAVGTVLDVTERPYQIVGWRRKLGLPYPELQGEIEDLFATFGGELYVEANGPGAPVIDNLRVPAYATTTGPKSKTEMIAKLSVYLENGWLKFDSLPQLDRELLMYQWDDKGLVQDSVMSLAIALYNVQDGDILGVA